MKKTSILLLAAGFVLFRPYAAFPTGKRLDLKLRVYEGLRQGTLAAPKFVTSSYVQPTISASLRTDFKLEEEQSQIKRVFNLQDVTLLTEAELIIGEGGQAPDRVRHFFRLNGSAFSVQVVLLDWKSKGRFVVNFNEILDDRPQNVLTTDMTLTGGHSAVFGFENRQGKTYFCSLHIAGPPDSVPAVPPPPPPAPRPAALREAIEEFERGAVKAVNAVNPPRLLKFVDAEFPEAARGRGIREGSVYLNLRVDELGNVKKAMVVDSSDPLFESAALGAVKQWQYEPYIRDGRPREVVFSVNIRFRSDLPEARPGGF